MTSRGAVGAPESLSPRSQVPGVMRAPPAESPGPGPASPLLPASPLANTPIARPALAERTRLYRRIRLFMPCRVANASCTPSYTSRIRSCIGGPAVRATTLAGKRENTRRAPGVCWRGAAYCLLASSCEQAFKASHRSSRKAAACSKFSRVPPALSGNRCTTIGPWHVSMCSTSQGDSPVAVAW